MDDIIYIPWLFDWPTLVTIAGPTVPKMTKGLLPKRKPDTANEGPEEDPGGGGGRVGHPLGSEVFGPRTRNTTSDMPFEILKLKKMHFYEHRYASDMVGGRSCGCVVPIFFF